MDGWHVSFSLFTIDQGQSNPLFRQYDTCGEKFQHPKTSFGSVEQLCEKPYTVYFAARNEQMTTTGREDTISNFS